MVSMTKIKTLLGVSFISIIIIVAPIESSIAQEIESSNLLKITVTGTKKETNVKDYAGSVEIIDKNDLDIKSSANLRKLIKDIPGITTRNSFRTGVRGTPGITELNIRGLDGDRILFMIDGIRLPERYEYGGYYQLGRANYIDYNTLNSVEILKGSSSSLYGSDALGGVISHRSLIPSDVLDNDSKFNIELPITLSTEDDSRSISIKTATKLSDKISALFIFTDEHSKSSNVKSQSKYIDDADNNGENYFVNAQIDFNKKSKLNLIYDEVNRISRINSSKTNLEIMSGSTKYNTLVSNTKTYKNRLSAEYNFLSSDNNSPINRANALIYKQISRIEDNFSRNITTPDKITADEDKLYSLDTDMMGGTLEFSSKIPIGGIYSNFVYGVDYSRSNGSRIRRTLNHARGTDNSEKDTPDTNIIRTGLYIQDEFSTGKFDFIAGIRYDNYNLDAKIDSIYEASGSSVIADDQSNSTISPKFSINYNIDNDSSLYAQYSRGFRPPSWYEINSSFSNPSYGYTTISNPDLQPETSNDYEIGYRMNNDKIDLSISGYYNDYDDFIEAFAAAGTTSSGLALYKSQNVKKAEIFGVEMALNYFFNTSRDGFKLTNTLAWSEGNDLTDDIPLTTIVPFTNRLSLAYNDPDDFWSVSLGMTYVGRPRVEKEYQYFVPKEYTTFDIDARLNISESAKLNAGLYNLFNKRYYNFQDVKGRLASASEITKYSQPGRNLQIGITYKF